MTTTSRQQWLECHCGSTPQVFAGKRGWEKKFQPIEHIESKGLFYNVQLATYVQMTSHTPSGMPCMLNGVRCDILGVGCIQVAARAGGRGWDRPQARALAAGATVARPLCMHVLLGLNSGQASQPICPDTSKYAYANNSVSMDASEGDRSIKVYSKVQGDGNQESNCCEACIGLKKSIASLLCLTAL